LRTEMTVATVKTIEEDFHRHLEVLLQLIGLSGSNGPAGSSTTPVPRKLPLNASPGNKRRS